MKYLSLLFFSFVCATACFVSSCSKDDDVDPLFILVSPDTTAVLYTGQQQFYRISFHARDNQLVRNLKIVSEDKNNSEKTLLDTTFNVTPINFGYSFYQDGTYSEDILLRFTAVDTNGNVCRIDRKVKAPVVVSEE